MYLVLCSMRLLHALCTAWVLSLGFNRISPKCVIWLEKILLDVDLEIQSGIYVLLAMRRGILQDSECTHSALAGIVEWITVR